MEVSVSKQAFVFLAMVVCGFLCGFVFDFFRAVRRLKSSGKAVIAAQDITLWLIELVIVYHVLFKLNYAHIRAYEAVALVVGSFLYFMTLSMHVVSAISRFLRFIYKVSLCVLKPIIKILGIVLKPLAKVKLETFKFVSSVRVHLKLHIRDITHKVSNKSLSLIKKIHIVPKNTTKKGAPE